MAFTSWDLPPTPMQFVDIFRLSIALRLHTEVEIIPMTRKEARDVIYQLRDELRSKKLKR